MHNKSLQLIIFLLILFSYQTSVQGRITELDPCTLTQKKVHLASFDPKNTYIAQINNQGTLLGQISLDKHTAYFWSLLEPKRLPHKLQTDKSKGQTFSDIDLLSSPLYSVIDSRLPTTHIQRQGIIIVIDNLTKQSQQFKTSTFDGNMRSKYAISARGTLAYVPNYDPKTVVFYDLVAERKIGSWKYNFCTISALAFHPSGDIIAIKDVCGKAARLFDVASGRITQTLTSDVSLNDDFFSPRNSLFFWAKGTQLAVNADPTMTALSWDLRTNEATYQTLWYAPLPMFHNRTTTNMAITDFTGGLNIFKMNDPTIYIDQPFGPEDFIWAAAFSPSDRYVAVSGIAGGNIAITDGENPLCFGQLESANNIEQIAFMNERSFYTLSSANAIDQWQIDTPRAEQRD